MRRGLLRRGLHAASAALVLAFLPISAPATALEVEALEAQGRMVASAPDQPETTALQGAPARLSIHNVALTDALRKLQEASGIPLAFSPSLLPEDLRVSCACENVTVEEAIRMLLQGTSFEVAVVADHVVIHERPTLRARLAGPAGSSEPDVLPVSMTGEIETAITGAHVFPRTRARQQATVVGQVVDGQTNEPLSAVQVSIRGTGQGALTDVNGRYQLTDVPPGNHVLEVTRIGYRTVQREITVVAGGTATEDFRLDATALEMDAVVVTGVAAATPRSQLPFTVESLDFTAQPVLPSSADGLLQGRLPGVHVVSASGQPGTAASIQLRAPTSLTQGQDPLVIVDGVILGSDLSDVDPRDVAHIEVVKGAAAASLYGSRAQAGVIEITTKSGSSLPEGRAARYTLRNELIRQQVRRTMELPRSHPYQMNEDQTRFVDQEGNEFEYGPGVVLDGANLRQTFQDKPYPEPTADPFGQLFQPGLQHTTQIGIEGRHDATSYRVSVANHRDEGILREHTGYQRRNIRVNLEHALSDRLRLQLHGYFAQSERDNVAEGAGFGLWWNVMMLNPTADLLATDPETGDLRHMVDELWQRPNPLYQLRNLDQNISRRRWSGSTDLSYSPTSWLSLQGNFSIDRLDRNARSLQPFGYLPETGVPQDGNVSVRMDQHDDMNLSLTASLTREFGDWAGRTRVRWLTEETSLDRLSAQGSGFSSEGVQRLGLLTRNIQVDSFEETIRSEGWFVVSGLDYQQRYIADFLFRRDGSSLFGPAERWQSYFRASGAWRVAQEPWWPISWITELKPRYSYGTAGGRPSFDHQYESYQVVDGAIRPNVLGNENLRPEFAVEQELGVDVVLFNRVVGEFSYIATTVDDQLLLAPLSSHQGFTRQWRNAGMLESTAIEASLQARVIQRPDLTVTNRLNFDRTRQVLSRLDVPAYLDASHRTSFFIVEGEPLGSFWGFEFATGCHHLPAGTDCGQFQVNDEGFLVYVGGDNTYRDGKRNNLWGTSGEVAGRTYDWGIPFVVVDESGSNELRPLGNTTPDFTVSSLTTVQWRNLSLHALLDAQVGGEVYFQTGQWALRDMAGPGVDQAGKPDELKKPVAYHQTLYLTNNQNSHFVEDATFLKLRELAVGYRLGAEELQRWLGRDFGLSDVRIDLVGRNLHTWTGYPGYDPEVGQANFGGSAAVGRVDEYMYPNFRSFGLNFQLTF